MTAPPEKSSDEQSGFFKKDGLFYARLPRFDSGQPLEIALHGILSEEQAIAAVQALTIPSETIK